MHSYKDLVLLYKIHLWLAAHVSFSTQFIFTYTSMKVFKEKRHLPSFKKKEMYIFFHILHVLPCFFTCCDPIVCGIVRKLPLLHYSFMKVTAANLFVWTEKMCTNRGMNSSTLNDPFQPPWWRDCVYFFVVFWTWSVWFAVIFIVATSFLCVS